jgi:hypothetical protein
MAIVGEAPGQTGATKHPRKSFSRYLGLDELTQLEDCAFVVLQPTFCLLELPRRLVSRQRLLEGLVLAGRGR